jgi:hypothetical protein
MYEDIRSAKLQQILAPLLDHYYGPQSWIYCGILEANHRVLSKNTHRFRICNHTNANELIENHTLHSNKISQDLTYLISTNFPDTKWYHNFGTDLVNNPYSLSTDNTTRDLFIDLSFSNPNIYQQNDQVTDMQVDDPELINMFDQFNLHHKGISF